MYLEKIYIVEGAIPATAISSLPQQEKGKRSGMIQNTSGGTNERQIH
jgi:hypothetical protein